MSTPVSSPKPLHPITPSFRSSTPVQTPLTRFGSAGKDTTHFGSSGSDNSGSSQDSGWDWKYWVSLPFRLPLVPIYVIKNFSFTAGWNEAFGIQSDDTTGGETPPTPTPQQPGPTPQQPGPTPQQPGPTPQQPGPTPSSPETLETLLTGKSVAKRAEKVLAALQSDATQADAVDGIRSHIDKKGKPTPIIEALLKDPGISNFFQDNATTFPALAALVLKIQAEQDTTRQTNVTNLTNIFTNAGTELSKKIQAFQSILKHKNTDAEKVALFVKNIDSTVATQETSLIALQVLAAQDAKIQKAVLADQTTTNQHTPLGHIQAFITTRSTPPTATEKALAKAAMQILTKDETKVVTLLSTTADTLEKKKATLEVLDPSSDIAKKTEVKDALKAYVKNTDTSELALKYFTGDEIADIVKDAQHGNEQKAILTALAKEPTRTALLNNANLSGAIENLAKTNTSARALVKELAELVFSMEKPNAEFVQHVAVIDALGAQIKAEADPKKQKDMLDKLDTLDSVIVKGALRNAFTAYADPTNLAGMSTFLQSTNFDLNDTVIRNKMVDLAQGDTTQEEDRKTLIKSLYENSYAEADKKAAISGLVGHKNSVLHTLQTASSLQELFDNSDEAKLKGLLGNADKNVNATAIALLTRAQSDNKLAAGAPSSARAASLKALTEAEPDVKKVLFADQHLIDTLFGLVDGNVENAAKCLIENIQYLSPENAKNAATKIKEKFLNKSTIMPNLVQVTTTAAGIPEEIRSAVTTAILEQGRPTDENSTKSWLTVVAPIVANTTSDSVLTTISEYLLDSKQNDLRGWIKSNTTTSEGALLKTNIGNKAKSHSLLPMQNKLAKLHTEITQ